MRDSRKLLHSQSTASSRGVAHLEHDGNQTTRRIDPLKPGKAHFAYNASFPAWLRIAPSKFEAKHPP
jgi:hypothetical protein